MKKEEIKKIQQVRFCDMSDYDSEKCSNGGCYGFWTDYIRISPDTFEISHGTTADFEYCPVCGTFNDHYEGEETEYLSGYSCGEYETISENELLNLINEFVETETEYIEFPKREKEACHDS